jgi:hypothetical protein
MPAFNPANTGSWYQVALVYDGTKATSYLNGVPVAVSPGFSLASSSLLGILGGIKVNGVLSGGGGTGYLGPLAVYASALTSNQVAYFYNTSVRR